MGCWFNNHNYNANPHDRDYNDTHCVATCTKCGKAKWIDFGEYSRMVGLITTTSGGYGRNFWVKDTRDMVKTMTDPWGRAKTKEIIRKMDEWREAGYPTGGM